MFSLNDNPLVLVILGPTASGKSRLAFALARLTGGEIVSADSRQIYRELDIGSAKPPPQELHEVRHHFIDEKIIGEPFTAGHFAIEAQKRIRDILKRGKPVIVAGGSTLYLRGLLEGFSELPASNPEIRAKLQQDMKRLGRDYLYEKLLQRDPKQASTLDPSKTQRLIRSLEIIESSGVSVTELLEKGKKKFDGIHFLTVGLTMPRDRLYERINQRTCSMIDAGLVDEAEILYRKYRPHFEERKIQALQSVGYQELFDFFQGKTGFDSAVELIRQHTRNYAKRQLTFFKNTLSVNWTDAPENEREFTKLLGQLSAAIQSPQTALPLQKQN